MIARRFTGCALLLGLASCQPAPAPDATDERLAAMQTELAAMQTKLDAMQTKLDSTATGLEALEAESRPSLPPPIPSRVIDGASESIECTGFETANIDCKIDRAFMTSLFDDADSLAKQARIVPVERHDESIGYKVYGIRPGSLPKLLGIKNGDTITNVGGKPLDSLDVVLEVFEGFRESERIVVGIERRGAPIVLTIDKVDAP